MYEEPVAPEVRNYYADLGVSDEAEEDDIKAAYRRLVLHHHPDKKAPGQAIDTAEFRKVQEAYEVLRYKSTRRTYHDGEYQVWPRYWRARNIFELHEDEQRQQEAERAKKAVQCRKREEKERERQAEQMQRKKTEREVVERRHQERKWQLRVDREDARKSAIVWENDMHRNALVAGTVVIDERDRCLCEGCIARRWREDDELLAPLPSMHDEERVKFLQWRAKEAELRAAQRAREEQERQAKERLEKEKQKEAARKREEAAQKKKQAAAERKLNCFKVRPKLSSFITTRSKKVSRPTR